MALGEGIEWAAHVCALLAALPAGRTLSVAALAEFHEVPKAYLAKHMQALARAGLVRSSRGPNGGYNLARPASEISLWDVREALEGAEPDFRCQEIRRRGPVLRGRRMERPARSPPLSGRPSGFIVSACKPSRLQISCGASPRIWTQSAARGFPRGCSA